MLLQPCYGHSTTNNDWSIPAWELCWHYHPLILMSLWMTTYSIPTLMLLRKIKRQIQIHFRAKSAASAKSKAKASTRGVYFPVRPSDTVHAMDPWQRSYALKYNRKARLSCWSQRNYWIYGFIRVCTGGHARLNVRTFIISRVQLFFLLINRKRISFDLIFSQSHKSRHNPAWCLHARNL